MWRAITRSIRNKVILVVIATNFAALIVAGVALAMYEVRGYREVLANDLATQGEILGRASAPALEFEDPKSADAYLALLEARPMITAAAIYNAKGKLFASYKRDVSSDQELPLLPHTDGHRIMDAQMEFFSRIVEHGEILGTVFLRAHYPIYERLAKYLGILGAVMVLSMLVALFVVAWLQARLTRPILAVTDTARQVMSNRDYSLRVGKTTEDEIGYLVDAFNDMLAEIGNRAETNEASNRKLEHEVAERMRAEDDLRKLNLELEERVTSRTEQLANVNKELEAFSYSVSHDLRAPLRAITGFSNLLVEDHGDQLDVEARRKLEVIMGEATRMGTLIDDLLAFSRLGRKAMQYSEVDMAEMVRTTYASLCKQHSGPPPELHLGSLPNATGDPSLLGQVWVNLLSNAIKFSSNKQNPVIEVNAISDAHERIYFVRDNGAGFDSRYESKLFEVFQRLHDSSEFPGTGVGLALVRRIVSRHGGRVWAESRLGEGATFYFSLPKEHANEPV
ncbi:MAG TPA: ATP-binding protein [Gammaproteobacteria bacterium]